MDIVTDEAKLKQPCRPAPDILETLTIANLMLAELEDRKGLGLAANQVGHETQICVLKGNIVLVNPVITKAKGSQDSKEHCLSLPDVECNVKRPKKVTVKAVNQYYQPVKYHFEGQMAKIACHEIDHLQGILMTDRVNDTEALKV